MSNSPLAENGSPYEELRLSPELAEIQSVFSQYEYALETVVPAAIGTLKAVREYKERRFVSEYPLPEELNGQPIVELLPALGKAATNAYTGKYTDPEYSPKDGERGFEMGKNTKVGKIRFRHLHEIDVAESNLTVLTFAGFSQLEILSTRDKLLTEAALDSVKNTDSSNTWVDSSTATKMIKRFIKDGGEVLNIEEPHDVNDLDHPFRWMERFKKFLETIPSEATLDTIAGLAYLDTLRGMLDNDIVYSPQMSAMLKERGANDDEVAMYSAARTLDMARMVIDEPSDTKRMTALCRIVGLNVLRSSLTATSKMAAESRAFKGSRKLIAHGHDAMVAIHQANNNRLQLQILLDNDEYSTADYVKTLLNISFETLDKGNDAFYDSLAELDLSSDDIIEQALALEEAKNAKVESIIATLQSTGLFRKDEIYAMHDIAEPKLANWLEAVAEKEELDSLHEFAESIAQQIEELESPYKYTSSRIRSFENGLDLIRDLNDMGKDDLPLSASDIQTLALLILQSEESIDKEAYFNELVSRRDEIEKKLADLEFLGLENEYQSNLVNVLKWIDELVDSGKDSTVKNRHLLRFLDNYYLGYEDNQPEDPNLDANNVDENDQDETEDTEEINLEAPMEDSIDDREIPSPVEAYMATLVDMLDEVDVSWVDIDVFPPSKGDRVARGNKSNRDESLIDIDPARLKHIIELKKSLERKGKIASLMVTNPTSWSPLPPFILYTQEVGNEETGVCLIESPVNGNASYVFQVDGQLIQDWRELVQMGKAEARSWGADTLIHPTKNAANFGQHYNLRLMNYILLGLAAEKSY